MTSSPSQIAKNILKLSDYFIENPSASTPWSESWAQEAYLNYYHHLNLQRLTAVFEEAQRLHFFENIQNFIDFGAGMGTATMAYLELQKHKPLPHMNFALIEKSQQAQSLSQKMFPLLNDLEWHSSMMKQTQLPSVFVFSYSLTELKNLPSEALSAEALILVEPSTRQDGRALMSLRSELIQKGFYLWAPCIHQKDCPLLTQSKTDWCHHRIPSKNSPEFAAIEAHLPMKNKTLTLSYLLARKTPPPENLSSMTRVIGDILDEKGKTRVAICRGTDREYLSWLKRDAITLNFERGQLVTLPENLQKKGNELRLKVLS